MIERVAKLEERVDSALPHLSTKAEYEGARKDLHKGHSEMNPGQLKETTMSPATRSMIKITLPAQYEDRQPVKDLVERLMGRDPAKRFEFIQNSAAAVDEDAIDA